MGGFGFGARARVRVRVRLGPVLGLGIGPGLGPGLGLEPEQLYPSGSGAASPGALTPRQPSAAEQNRLTSSTESQRKPSMALPELNSARWHVRKTAMVMCMYEWPTQPKST